MNEKVEIIDEKTPPGTAATPVKPKKKNKDKKYWWWKRSFEGQKEGRRKVKTSDWIRTKWLTNETYKF